MSDIVKVTCTLLMGMLIGTRWMNKGDTVELDEAYASDLATMKPPRVQIGGAASPASDIDSSSEAGSEPENSDGTDDDSLEAAGFAGKTLHLLQAAGIQTVTDLKAKIDAGEKIASVGEKTLASIQAQLAAAAE